MSNQDYKRASYLDLLMAETRRAVQQSTPVTVALMQFGKSSGMVKEHGEKAVEAAMQKVGQIFAANIRQNDLAFRYEMTTIALVLGETAEKEGLMAVEKLRKLLADVKLSDELLPFSAGLAEAVVRQQFDPVDIVTEVINRADMALDMAVVQGMGRIVSLALLSCCRNRPITPFRLLAFLFPLYPCALGDFLCAKCG
jgi:GGDEF domain-containing protein